MRTITLTVFFDGRFYVGVFERKENSKLSVCKVVFGAEPKDTEVSEYILRRYNDLKFGKPLDVERKISADNPKRRLKNVKKQMKTAAIGTKSQQALSARREEIKKDKQQKNKLQREEEKRRMYALRKEKQKEKHRGR